NGMSNYGELFCPAVTPQSEPIPGTDQGENSAGGFVFQIDKWARLRRFLILGADSSTYYQTARKMTRENAECVIACWKDDPDKTSNEIIDVSYFGRAPKNDPAIFALALGSVLPAPYVEARRQAFAAVQHVCR